MKHEFDHFILCIGKWWPKNYTTRFYVLRLAVSYVQPRDPKEKPIFSPLCLGMSYFLKKHTHFFKYIVFVKFKRHLLRIINFKFRYVMRSDKCKLKSENQNCALNPKNGFLTKGHTKLNISKFFQLLLTLARTCEIASHNYVDLSV